MATFKEYSSLHLESKAKVFVNAKVFRTAMTEAEVLLWNALRNRRVNGIKFRRQHPIKRFIADFYCHEARLVVEVDGEIRDESKIQEYDEGRTYELSEFDIKVIRFTNKEVMDSLDIVLLRINKVVQESLIERK